MKTHYFKLINYLPFISEEYLIMAKGVLPKSLSHKQK